MNSILIPESLLHEKTYNADKYFNERFPSDYTTMEDNPNYSESGCGIAVTASDTENTLSIKDPADSSKELCKLTYSNGKLKFTYKKPAMVNNITMVGVGSTEKLNILDNNFDILHLNVVKKLGGVYNVDINDTLTSICYGNSKFVVLTSGPNNYNSPDGVNWTPGGMQNYEWGCICYGNGKYVALDCYYLGRNIFAYSTDGINWTQGTMPASTFWRSVTYGNGKFVAVTESSISAYSTDGINWTQTAMPSEQNWISVCYGDNKFVAVATENNVSAYSTDGINWTQTAMPSGDIWTSVCYGDNKFVAVGYERNSYAYSYNGYQWYAINLSNVLMANSMCYSPDHNYYVTVGDHIISIISIPDAYAGGVCNTFAVEYSWSGSIPSGVTLPNPTSYASGATVTVDTKYTSDSIIQELGEWTQGTMPSKQRWYSVCYGNGKYVATSSSLTTSGTSNIFAYSTDGITWTQGTMPSSQNWESVCYGNGKFIAIAHDSNIFAYSTDGINWTQGTMPASTFWRSVTYGNGKFVAVAYQSNTFAYSTDGINWTQGTMPASTFWRSVTYGNGKFVAIAWSSNIFAYSTDGINWTQGTMPSKQYWKSVCYGNGKFVAVSDQSIVFAYSTDGITWTQGTMPKVNTGWYSVCYGNSNFVTVSGYTFAYSTDGINWTEGTMNQYYNLVCYGNGKFVAINYGSNTSKFDYLTLPDTYYQFSGWNKSGTFNITSDTSITGRWTQKSKLSVTYSWTNAPTGMTSTVPAKVTGLMPNETVAVDSKYTNKSAYKDTTNKKYYKFSGWNKSGEFNITSNTNISGSWDNGTAITPEISWTSRTIDSTGHYFKECCYGNGVYLIACHNTNFVLYSTDGINWTQKTISSTSRNWYACCYGNGKYILFTNTNNNYSAYSTDGINWTEKSNTFSNINSGAFMSGAYGNSKYVFITNQPEIIYSTDGINWSAADLTNISTQLQGICFANGKFVAVGNGGSGTSLTTHKFLYSTDGVTWKEGSSINTSGSYYWNNVAYGNNKFVAIGYSKSLSNGSSGTTSVAYSTDGINWTLKTILSAGKTYGLIVYDGSYFISVASNSTYYMYSLDGLTWTEYSGLPSSAQWGMLRNLNGMLVTYPVVFFTTNTYIVTMSTYPTEYNYVS